MPPSIREIASYEGAHATFTKSFGALRYTESLSYLPGQQAIESSLSEISVELRGNTKVEIASLDLVNNWNETKAGLLPHVLQASRYVRKVTRSQDYDISIKLILVPTPYGYLHHKASLALGKYVRMELAVRLDPDNPKSISDAINTTAHELYHLLSAASYFRQKNRPTLLDEETEAYVVGACVELSIFGVAGFEKSHDWNSGSAHIQNKSVLRSAQGNSRAGDIISRLLATLPPSGDNGIPEIAVYCENLLQ